MTSKAGRSPVSRVADMQLRGSSFCAGADEQGRGSIRLGNWQRAGESAVIVET